MSILKKRVVIVVINFIFSSYKEKAVLFHVGYLSHLFFWLIKWLFLLVHLPDLDQAQGETSAIKC